MDSTFSMLLLKTSKLKEARNLVKVIQLVCKQQAQTFNTHLWDPRVCVFLPHTQVQARGFAGGGVGCWVFEKVK